MSDAGTVMKYSRKRTIAPPEQATTTNSAAALSADALERGGRSSGKRMCKPTKAMEAGDGISATDIPPQCKDGTPADTQAMQSSWERLQRDSSAWLQAASLDPVLLGMELAQSLAEASRTLREAVWAAQDASAVAAIVPPAFATLPLQLTDAFKHFIGRRFQDDVADGGKAAIPGILAALFLARACFDTVAITRVANGGSSAASPEEEQAIHMVLQFLSAVVRAAFAANPSDMPRMQKEGIPLAEELVIALAGVWRAAHFALAATSYEPSSCAHRVVQLALRCFGGGPGIGVRISDKEGPPSACCAAAVELQTAVADLLLAVLGQAGEALQTLALEGLVGASGFQVRPAASKGGGRRRQRASPLPYTAALLRAVCAATLPTQARLGGGTGFDGKLCDLATKCRTQAEDWAATLTTGIIRQCLLGQDRESVAWAHLEAVTQDLLGACKEPEWPSAPLLLLCLCKGLVRVAGAARSVEMSWTKREFAMRLLGQISSSLCTEHAKTSGDAAELDLQDLKRCVIGTAPSFKNPQEEASWFLSHRALCAPVGAPVRRPSCMVAAMGKARNAFHLAVVPADHPVFTAAQALCMWADACGAEDAAADQGKKRSSGRSSRVSQKPAAQPVCPVPEWAARLWASWGCGDRLDSKPAKPSKAYEKSAKTAAALYGRLAFAPRGGMLCKARVVSLEAILGQLQGSPLAFVRRQCVSGLAGSCEADASLLESRCVAAGVAAGLRDESSLVRVSTVDLVGRMVKHSSLVIERCTELRAAAAAQLGDAAPGVRRAAFRVVCEALHREDPKLVAVAVDLLRRVRHEAAPVRELVLSSVGRVLLGKLECETTLQHLVGIVASPEVGAAGLKDVLHVHLHSKGQEALLAELPPLVNAGMGHAATAATTVTAGPPTSALQPKAKAKAATAKVPSKAASTALDPVCCAIVLSQVGSLCPAALHQHVPTLIVWLSVGADAPEKAMGLAKQACRMLSDVVASWAASASSESRHSMGQALQKVLSSMAQLQRHVLTRPAVECLCMVARHLTNCFDLLLGMVQDSFRHLQGIIEERGRLDAASLKILLHHAWLLGSAHEFADIDGLLAGRLDDTSRHGMSEDVAKMLSTFSLYGPASIQPLLLPPLGFFLHRHYRMLQMKSPSYEALRAGLLGGNVASGSSSSSCAAALRSSSIEVLASMLSHYKQAAEAGTPPGGIRDAGVAAALSKPKISEAVQSLSGLQPEVISILVHADAPTAAVHALESLQCMSHLGVLHPSTALPALLAASLVGFRHASTDARRLLLRLVEQAPQLLPSRLGCGLRRAVTLLLGSAQHCLAVHGELAVDDWRFLAFKEACAEHLDHRRMRDKVLDSVVDEIVCLATCAPGDLLAEGAPESQDMGKAQAQTWKSILFRAELALGLLGAFPYRCEADTARVVRASAHFLTLRALPLLPEVGHEGGSPQLAASTGITVFAVCTASLALHALSGNLCGAGDMERILAAATSSNTNSDETNKPLPPTFSRRPSLGSQMAPILEELVVASSSESPPAAALEVLARHVQPNSPLLRVPGATREGTCSRRRQPDHSRSEADGGNKRRKKQGRTEDSLVASAMTEAASDAFAKEAEEDAQQKGRRRKGASSSGGAAAPNKEKKNPRAGRSGGSVKGSSGGQGDVKAGEGDSNEVAGKLAEDM